MSKDVVNEKDFTPLSEQASHWWAVLHDENASAADYREFGEWVLRSPERVEAILQTARLMRALQSQDVRWPDTAVETLIREASAAPTDVIPFQARTASDAEPRAERRRARTLLPYAAGIAAIAVTAAVASWYALTGPETHRTALGEQRSVVLEDGSLVTLNTSSQIEADIDDQRRVVRLVAGEALFQVAHETRRPFDVIAGDATVRAVGTQFNVDRHSASTIVTVVEGRVAVLQTAAKHGETGETPRFLAAAERAVIKAGEISATEPVANLAAATAWTQRRLVFDRRPLGEVAAEFNRYNRRLIVIDSVELRDQEVTGTFQANDPDSFVAFLAQVPGVKVSQNAGNISVTAQD